MNNLNKFLRDFDLNKFMTQGIVPAICLGVVLLIATFLGPLVLVIAIMVLIAIVTIIMLSMGSKE